MTNQLESFIDKYRSLAVVTCEWRAFEVADPEQLADEVFRRLANSTRTINLRLFYSVVEDVIDFAYRQQLDSNSLILGLFKAPLEAMTAQQSPSELATSRKALARLSDRNTRLLQQFFWDELSLAEMAEVNGRDTRTQRQRIDRALSEFASRLPAELAVDPAAVMRRLHPGNHRR